MPCKEGERGNPVSAKTAIALLVLMGALIAGVYFMVILPANAPLTCTLYIKDAQGTKHYLQRSFFINGLEATAIGVDYSFAVTGETAKVFVKVQLWDVTAGEVVMRPGLGAVQKVAYVPVSGSGSNASSGPYIGSFEWTCDDAFAGVLYQDGAQHTLMFKGTAQAYNSAGTAIGPELAAQSVTFTEKYDPGGLTDFNIYV
jgi:hypothetical protein